MKAAESPDVVGDGDVDAAGALHVDDEDFAAFACVVEDLLQLVLGVGAVVEEPLRVDGDVVDLDEGGEWGDEIVAVTQDQLRAAGFLHCFDVGGDGLQLRCLIRGDAVLVDYQLGFMETVDLRDLAHAVALL
ncbi:hypothetical protein [Nocardia gipuzkoensis]|uniref:hypothetical protein n=1 Tax=Nocardia gipuzkoensis TaxID=2749991 RepID=UPI001F2581F1|nr:hypothetical protein [Nocardia gipuzkoensis]